MKKLTQDFIEYVYEVQLVRLDRVKLYLVRIISGFTIQLHLKAIQ